MLSLKVTEAGMIDRLVENSSAHYKMGICHPLSMKIGTEIRTESKKNIVISDVTKAAVTDCFQDGRRLGVGNSSACYKMGNCHRTLTKTGTQTKRDLLSSNVMKAEAYVKNGEK